MTCVFRAKLHETVSFAGVHSKFIDFRDRFAREKRNLESTVLSLQSSLELTQERMNKEEEYKGTTQAAQKQLMGEKRELLAK